jgi:isopenicillin-N epimerase
MFSAKGCAFLYSSQYGACQLHPTVISNSYGDGFPEEFDWQGTRDYSMWLSVTAALDFLRAIGVDRYRNYLNEQADEMANVLSECWKVALPAPPNALGAMITLPFPVNPGLTNGATVTGAKYWHDKLWNEHRIEVPILAFNNRFWVRLSAQVYNDVSDCMALIGAIKPEVN